MKNRIIKVVLFCKLYLMAYPEGADEFHIVGDDNNPMSEANEEDNNGTNPEGIQQTPEGTQQTPGDVGQNLGEQADKDRELADADYEKTTADYEKTTAEATQVLETSVQLSGLVEDIENLNIGDHFTLSELLKGTKTEKRLLAILNDPQFSELGESPEKRLERIFTKVDTVITKYLVRQFSIDSQDPKKKEVISTMSTAIQCFLIDVLKNGGNAGNNDILGQLTSILDSLTNSSFDGKKLLEHFSNIAKTGNFYYQKVKRLQKVIDFFSLHPDVLNQAADNKYEEFSDPCSFYHYINDDSEDSPNVWTAIKDEEIADLTLDKIKLTLKNGDSGDPSKEQEKSDAIDALQKSFADIHVVDNPNTTSKIVSILKQTEKFLDDSSKIKDTVLGIAQQVDDVFKIFGSDVIDVFEGSPILKGIASMFLSFIGFPGGFSGLKRALDSDYATTAGTETTSESTESHDSTQNVGQVKTMIQTFSFQSGDFLSSEEDRKVLRDCESDLSALKTDDPEFNQKFETIKKNFFSVVLKYRISDLSSVVEDESLPYNVKTDLKNLVTNAQNVKKVDTSSSKDLYQQCEILSKQGEQLKMKYLVELMGRFSQKDGLDGEKRANLEQCIKDANDSILKDTTISFEELHNYNKKYIDLLSSSEDSSFGENHPWTKKYTQKYSESSSGGSSDSGTGVDGGGGTVDAVETGSLPSGISDEMFTQLKLMEGEQASSEEGFFVAKTHSRDFGERFPTGPYGMVYKRIDENGNPLSQAVPFDDGEQVTQERAEKNARAYYDRSAKEWKNVLQGKTYTQHQLDALVSASGGTTASKESLQKFVLENWDIPNNISSYLLTFATKAAGNGEVQKGLVIRREFESQWFMGGTKTFQQCYTEYEQAHPIT